MKKLLLSALFITVLAGGQVFGQSGAIKANPLGLLFGVLNLGYEHVLNEKSSIEGGLAYANTSATIGSDLDASVTGIGAYAMYRMYVGKKDSPRGIYVAPSFSFNSASGSSSVDGDDAEGSTTILSFGAIFGNQWVWGDGGGFVLDLGIGAAYYSASTSGDISGISLDGIGPAVRIAIGYAF